jgi:hypothetical protein
MKPWYHRVVVEFIDALLPEGKKRKQVTRAKL